MKKTILKTLGDEPVCPKCGHNNAMLHVWDKDENGQIVWDTKKCRDCGFVAKNCVIEPLISKCQYCGKEITDNINGNIWQWRNNPNGSGVTGACYSCENIEEIKADMEANGGL